MSSVDYAGYGGRRPSLESVTMLEAAARADDGAVSRALASDADVNTLDSSGRSIVTCAIAGDSDVSWESLDVSDASFKVQNRLKILELVLSHHSTSLYTLNAPVRGVSPLCLAAWLDLPQVVRLLVENSKGLVSVNGTDSYGATPLMYAARDGRISTVCYLLANGARPDYRDINHRSSIQHATRHPLVLWLCERALRRDRLQEYMSKSHGDPAYLPQPYMDRLIASTAPDVFDTTKLPVSAISLKSCSQPTEVLVQAVISADLPHLRSLLFPSTSSNSRWNPVDAFVLVNLPDFTGWSPIHYCVSAKQPSMEVLDTLYRAGADVSLYTTSGHETPLHCLAYKAKPCSNEGEASSLRSFIIHLVRDLHAPMSARDHAMNTCLHIAAEHGSSVDVVKALLACDPSGEIRELRNSKGLTALDVARPDFRMLFGADREHARSVSSASAHTIRQIPSLRTSLETTVTDPRTEGRLHDDSLEMEMDYASLPYRVLDNLRSIAVGLELSISADLPDYARILEDTTELCHQLFSHFRSRTRNAVGDLQDTRVVFREVYNRYQKIKLSAERVKASLLDDVELGQDAYDHARRRTTDSTDSEATAVSDSGYVLLNRKCRSMSDLRLSREGAIASLTSSTIPPVPTLGVDTNDSSEGVRLPSPKLDAASTPEQGGHTESSASSIKELKRKRSHTFPSMNPFLVPSSDTKESTVKGAARLKAWLLKKIIPDSPSKTDVVRDERNSTVRKDVKPTTIAIRDYEIPHHDEVPGDVQKRKAAMICQTCLAAVRRDLSRIEECLDSAEELIILANRSIHEAEARSRSAIQSRRASLERARMSNSVGNFAPISFWEWTRSTGQDGHHFSRPDALSSTSACTRPRAKSAASSISSVPSTLIEGEDDDTRALRKLFTRKMESRTGGAEKEIEKVTVWLHVIEVTLREVGARTNVISQRTAASNC